MSRSTVIAGVILFAFVIYSTTKGTLRNYMQVVGIV